MWVLFYLQTMLVNISVLFDSRLSNYVDPNLKEETNCLVENVNMDSDMQRLQHQSDVLILPLRLLPVSDK